MTSSSSPATPPVSAQDPARLERVVRADYRFIWRLLRRFGVPQSHAEDAAQQVFLIVAERLQDIAPGRERSFAFGTALRLSASWKVPEKAGDRSPANALVSLPECLS